MRSTSVRVPLTLVLIALLALSILFIRNIVTAAWQRDQRQEVRYLRAPNCSPRQDPSEVEASLPPCRDITMTVIAKPQHTTVDHYRSHDYPTTHRLLTLRGRDGQTQTVGDIHSDMWDSVKVGDQVSVTLWQSQIRDVAANGYRSSIVDMADWTHAEAMIWPWIVLGLACSCCLWLLWGSGREPSG